MHLKPTCEQTSESHRQAKAGQTGRSPASIDPPMHDPTSNQGAKQLAQMHALGTCRTLAFVDSALDHT